MSYLVTGFYTPNYAGFAAEFAANLDTFRVPHRLYPVEMIGSTWLAQTLRKPEIVQRALADHPGKTIILMDIDCMVHGALDPMTDSRADISMSIRVNAKRGGAAASSRVLVVRPTDAARRLIETWRTLCDDAVAQVQAARLSKRQLGLRAGNIGLPHDERLLLEAVATTPSVMLDILPLQWAGAEAGLCPDPLVTHDSAHDRVNPKPQRRLKTLKRKVISKIMGRPYHEWKHGSTNPKRWG
jgi:hypothetical protein